MLQEFKKLPKNLFYSYAFNGQTKHLNRNKSFFSGHNSWIKQTLELDFLGITLLEMEFLGMTYPFLGPRFLPSKHSLRREKIFMLKDGTLATAYGKCKQPYPPLLFSFPFLSLCVETNFRRISWLHSRIVLTWYIDKTAKIASTAPAAPSRWPTAPWILDVINWKSKIQACIT